jgi:hypothetical protein
MSGEWTTKEKDLRIAQSIMLEYAKSENTSELGLLELVVNRVEKRMSFRLAGWVVAVAKHFSSVYGVAQGDYITRQVISCCLTQGQTLH